LSSKESLERRFLDLKPHFDKWEKVKDCADQFIDIMLNYRQSGHPGGSRSKVHALVASTLAVVLFGVLPGPVVDWLSRGALLALGR